jgi:hypothetical protein
VVENVKVELRWAAIVFSMKDIESFSRQHAIALEPFKSAQILEELCSYFGMIVACMKKPLGVRFDRVYAVIESVIENLLPKTQYRITKHSPIRGYNHPGDEEGLISLCTDKQSFPLRIEVWIAALVDEEYSCFGDCVGLFRNGMLPCTPMNSSLAVQSSFVAFATPGASSGLFGVHVKKHALVGALNLTPLHRVALR